MQRRKISSGGSESYNQFIDLQPLIDQRLHAILSGVTNSGKTTFLLSLLTWYANNTNDTLIYRDDTKLEVFFIHDKLGDKLLVWHPSGTTFNSDTMETKEFRTPRELVIGIHKYGNKKVNVILSDWYMASRQSMFDFWLDYLKEFLHFRKTRGLLWCQDRPITLFFDEINDIVTNTMYRIAGQGQVTNEGEWFVRKSRGFGVRIIASTHRIKTLSKGFWSQFSYWFFKRAHATDAHQVIQEMIPNIHPDQIKSKSKKIGYLKPSQVFIIDHAGYYGFIPTDDIKRHYPDIDIRGEWNYIGIHSKEKGTTKELKLALKKVKRRLQDVESRERRLDSMEIDSEQAIAIQEENGRLRQISLGYGRVLNQLNINPFAVDLALRSRNPDDDPAFSQDDLSDGLSNVESRRLDDVIRNRIGAIQIEPQ